MGIGHPARHPAPRHLACVSFLAILACLAFSASASADFTLCSAGSGAGQCERPEGIAVDRSNGRLYVADKRNNRIDVFDSAGSFLFAFGWGVVDGVTEVPQVCVASCFKGIAGPGAGQLTSGELSLAIDNDPASPSFHDVYVGERDNTRVQKFGPNGEFILTIGAGVNKTNGKDLCTAASGNVCGSGAAGGGDGEFNRSIIPAVGPGGTLLVADTASSAGQAFEAARVQSFKPSGEFIARLALLAEPSQDSALAVDSSGDFYLGLGAKGSMLEYSPSGVLLETRAVDTLNSLATDAADHLFASEVAKDSSRVVTEYDPDGNILRRFGYGVIEETVWGLAPSSTTPGDVYVAETQGDRVQYLTQPPPGPISCCLESTVGNTKAIIKGRVNPEGKATTYHFEYVDRESFDHESGFASPKTIKTAESASIGSDFSLHPFEAQIGCTNPEFPPQPSCLKPTTEYRFRLIATNADGNSEVEGEFETKAPFEILEAFATDVGKSEGRLHAMVNPLGIATTGYFEYVDDAKYQASGFAEANKAPDIDNAQSPLSFGSGETAEEVSVQISSLEPGTTYHYRVVVTDPFVSKAGPERTFTTFPLTAAPANPCPNAVFRIGPAAKLPDCRAYEMVSPVDKNGGDVKVLNSTLNYPARLEESSTDGNRFAYSSVTAFGDAVSAPWTSEYIATRHESEGWSTHAINPARESNSLTLNPAFKWDAQYKLFSPDLSEGWLIHDSDPPLDECAPEGAINLYRRDNSTDTYEALAIAKPTNVSADGYQLELQGVSADGDHAVFRANGKLTSKAAANGVFQVYEHVGDPEGGCGELKPVSVLPDGSAATIDSSLGMFEGLPGELRGSAVTNAVSPDGTRIFWSTRTGAIESLYLRDMEAGKTVPVAAGGRFLTASSDGSKALYAAGETLFEVDAAKALAGEAASTPIAGGFEGLAASTPDLSRVYFISSEDLGGEGEAGNPNLYLREGGTTRLVTILYGGDAMLPGGDQNAQVSQQGFAVGATNSVSNGVRVSANGSHLAFVSVGSLTGYDSTDVAADGRKALELYLYDAETDHLACVSCNPTGARPSGRAFKSLGSLTIRRVSARMPTGQNMLVTPRALTSDGNRLFFESFEALLPRDTNGKGDVYEWMRASGQKACDEVGAELYVPSSGGCLSLISSGLSPIDSELADISPDGTDVFIRTASSFLPQDPGQVDVYDARVNGGLPQPPTPPPACEGETCQGAPSPPNDPTPASAGFRGPTGAPGKPHCAKGKARRKGRCVAKKHQAKKQRAKKQSKRHPGRARPNR